jgi:hypothetical protein
MTTPWSRTRPIASRCISTQYEGRPKAALIGRRPALT